MTNSQPFRTLNLQLAMSSNALQWLSLVVIIWLQSVSGTNTNFPAYSPQLKELLSMSQVQLNNLAFASDAGKLFGFFSGIAALYLPLWLVLLIGSALGLVGYGLQYLFITHQISSLSYAHIFLLTVLAGNSICWINIVCYVVIIQNFPSDRQVSVGLTTSYQGLSAKIYTVLVDALFFSPDKRAKSYLLLNSILPLLVCVMAAPFVRDFNVGTSKNMEVGFMFMFFVTTATGIYAVISSLGSLPSWLPPLGNAICILVLLLAPLVIPVDTEILGAKKICCCRHRNGGDCPRTNTDNGSADVEGDVCRVEKQEESSCHWSH
ncbi:hypothetical protein DKX38_029923 [Salix brachista]|uniref:Nodulin-like domain-containing protein n=1 Tax=Salix brachista TaxID=2182728 RepID=A0A5N5J568_9ROSI|nr:hypothetical protein DKX38_029923 [Salix brachista]